MSFADCPPAYYLPQSSGASEAAQALDRISAKAYLHVRLAPPGRDQGLTDLYSVANEAGLLNTYDGIRTIERAVKLTGFLFVAFADGHVEQVHGVVDGIDEFGIEAAFTTPRDEGMDRGAGTFFS